VPLYDFECSACGNVAELNRDSVVRTVKCSQSECSGKMQRVWLQAPSLGKPKHQYAVVTKGGEAIKGNFGGGYRMDAHKRAKGKKT